MPLELYQYEAIRGDQEIYYSEKYYRWLWANQQGFENHHRFYVDYSLPLVLESRFNPFNNSITIKNHYLELPGLDPDEDYIDLSDPWFIDFPDPLYGNNLRNRGTNAIFRSRPSPFNPNSEDTYEYSKKHHGVFLNQGWPNWEPPYYSVKASTQDITLYNTGKESGRSHKFYFRNWSYDANKISLQTPGSNETAVVFKTSDAVLSANLKGTQLSNNSIAYTKGSQRKFIRIPNGGLYSVYESMSNIYLEKSTDGGASWQVFNNTLGQKLNNYPAHSPSMDFYNVSSLSGDVVLVTFVEELDALTARIMIVALKDKSGPPLLFTQEVSLVAKSVSGYGNPVIASAGGGKFIIIFKGWDVGSYGIYYRRGIINNWQLSWVEQDPYNLPKLNNTDANSFNPTIAEDRNTSGVSYQVAWQQSNTIRYCKLNEDANGNITQSNHSVISNGSSFMFHSSPSIIAMGTGARVCWLGFNDEEPPNTSVVFKDPANSRFWSFGSQASKPNINKSNDNTYYAFGWSQNSSTIKFADNSLSSVYEIVGIQRKDVQISNGNGKTNMHANIFKASNQPYFFTLSNNLNTYYSLQKQNALAISSGRTGVIRKNSGEIYFALGDITVNDLKIGFAECPIDLDINNVDTLNQYLETEPFWVNDNSGFEYTVLYGIVDTAVIPGMFSQGEQIRFRVELIDHSTSQVLEVFDDVIYDQNNLADFENILYHVNTQGLGQRSVKLRLTIEENINPELSMVDIVDNESVLGKIKNKEIKYLGVDIPKEFALEQNYPNPFNPVTIIKYQLPKDGMVTLKVYDILGAEVATLVNEEKIVGRYEVSFDASRLASGVYIYRLQANEYTSVKKMILLK